jgi:hypothetical protein
VGAAEAACAGRPGESGAVGFSDGGANPSGADTGCGVKGAERDVGNESEGTIGRTTTGWLKASV